MVNNSKNINESTCTSCGKALDMCTSVDGDYKPNPGDITVCIACGHVMAFDHNLHHRDLTEEEIIAIAGDTRITAINNVRKRFNNAK